MDYVNMNDEMVWGVHSRLIALRDHKRAERADSIRGSVHNESRGAQCSKS